MNETLHLEKKYVYLLKKACFVFVFFFSVCFVFAGKNSSLRYVFNDGWSWAVDEDGPRVYMPMKSVDIKKMTSYVTDGSGFVWLKYEFDVPDNLKDRNLAIFIGCIDIAAEFYLNGSLVSTAGRLPPNEFCAGAAAVACNFPSFMLNKQESNTFLIKLFVDGKGGLKQIPFLSTYHEVQAELENVTFVSKMINLMIAATEIIMALFYFFVFIRNTKDKEYLMWAVTLLGTVFYLVPYYIDSNLVLWNTMSYLTFQKIFASIFAFVTGFFATSFMIHFFHDRQSKNVIAVRLVLMIFPILITLFIPSNNIFSRFLPVLFLFLAAQIGFAVFSIIRNCLNGRIKQVIMLVSGFTPVLIGLVLDLIIKVMLEDTSLPLFTVFGWELTGGFFMFILTYRFSTYRKTAEYLNEKLESEVADRVKELKETNEKLQLEQDESNREMDLAVHVQRSFYPQVVSSLNGWDMAIHFRPFAGVSGDLYDFYTNGKELEGLSLFDVSGHGIAAGLITMLSKNIVFRVFSENRNEKLPVLMEKLNEAIIKAKGNIENYMVGLILRIDPDGTLEITNAGGPPPLLYSSRSGSVSPIQTDKKQFGMIGVADLPVSFQNVTFSMAGGDTVVFTTDGLTEATNPAGEEFGQERLIESLCNKERKTADQILAGILKDLSTFVGSEPLRDDITLIVLRKQTDTDIEELEAYGDLEELEEISDIDELFSGSDSLGIEIMR